MRILSIFILPLRFSMQYKNGKNTKHAYITELAVIQLNMKSTFYLFILLIASCHSKISSDIEGHWTTVNVVDKTGMHITDDASFNKDGSYKLIMYSNGDSIVSELQGTYKLDQSNQSITITTNGMTFQHKILELDNESMKIKTQQGTDVLMKRIK